MSKIITVVGATGTQGSSVISALLDNDTPTYTIRAITRNPQSAAAQSLSAKGITVLKADLNDITSLRTAFAGTHAIFAVTNFFEALPTLGIQQAMDTETAQGINLAIAAAQTPTLEHYIWSTLPNSAVNSEGKVVVPYYESKNRVDAYIRSSLPDLLKKTTFLWLAWFAGNMLVPFYTPTRIRTLDGSKLYAQFLSIPPTTPIPLLGDEKTNAGLFVRAILAQPHLTQSAHGRIVSTVLEYRPIEQVTELFSKRQGIQTRCLTLAKEDYKSLWPVWGEVFHLSHLYFEVMGTRAFSDVSGGQHEVEGEAQREVLTNKDLGVKGLVGVEEVFERLGVMEWE
ncbi:NAD(P)-binding protein [Aspergillus keveii]|uniref:NAD(P)-binding protein n=1 Tax=Aspergillus keveii TaxID=714993 RepID=A0ABR4GLI8_9EURO